MASAPHITHEDLLLIAAEAAEDNHLTSTRSFVARLIGHVPEEIGNKLAVTLDLPHLVSQTQEAAA